MSKNYVDLGWKVPFTAGADITEGAFMILGGTSGQGAIPCVAQHNVKNGSEGEALAGGIFNLAVHAYGESANEAVSIFDSIWLDGTELNKDETNGKLFGYALEGITSGATAIIKVLLADPYKAA